jgi:hypothetical protein
LPWVATKGCPLSWLRRIWTAIKATILIFHANVQYPLLMKQQSISDSVIKDLFGVAGKEL